jgi:signal transduction histidine kinase/DNA-binding response OmpR family regulator
MVGVIISAVNWAEIFASTFADAVTGIDIVMHCSSGQTYTYRVVNGEVHVTGEGDLHDTAFDSFAVGIDITQSSLFGPTSEHYFLTLYPSKDLYHVYCTKNPRYASLGAVCIIAFTSIMFMCFDFFVRRDSEAKQTLLDAKRKFVRFVSHEVRTPLNSVCMGLTLLKDEITTVLHDDDDNKDNGITSSTTTKLDRDLEMNCRAWLTLADEVAANANSAVDVLNDFLNYDKVESGKLTLDYTVVPIFDLIEETVSEFKLPAAKKKIVVSIRTPLSHVLSSHDGNTTTTTTSEEQFVVGDKVRLTQVFRNLISNAIKFTPDGGTVMVEAKWIPFSENTHNDVQHSVLDKPKLFPIRNDEYIICHRSNGSILLTVKDSGVGMTPLQVESVFQQGTQFNVNELQSGNGSGLGTYIAKGIVKQHGGVLYAISEGLQKGSTFSVSLPIYEIPADHVPEIKRMRDYNNKTVESDPVGSLKILVVDDAKMNLKLLMRLLEKQGHVTTGAEDGAVAVSLVREALEQNDPYDVILTDYQMPKMDGPTAAREIRRLGCDSFIVGITGNLMPEDIRYFKRAGANAVLPKPVRLPDLEALLIEYGIRAANEQEKIDLLTASQRYHMSFANMEGNLVVASTATSRRSNVVVQGDEASLVSSGEP